MPTAPPHLSKTRVSSCKAIGVYLAESTWIPIRGARTPPPALSLALVLRVSPRWAVLFNDHHFIIILIVRNDPRRRRCSHWRHWLRGRGLAHPALRPLLDNDSLGLTWWWGPAGAYLNCLTTRRAAVMVARVLATRLARHDAGGTIRGDSVAAPTNLEAGVDQPQKHQKPAHRA